MRLLRVIIILTSPALRCLSIQNDHKAEHFTFCVPQRSKAHTAGRWAEPRADARDRLKPCGAAQANLSGWELLGPQKVLAYWLLLC